MKINKLILTHSKHQRSVVRVPTTISIPPVREGVQHGDGIDETLEEDLQMV